MHELGKRLTRGDQTAFAELYDACADRVHRYLVVRLGSRHDADEVLQETFVRLARTRRRLARVENLVGYVFTVARNEAARWLRRRRRARGKVSTAGTEALLTEAVADGVQAREAADLVATALGRLAPEQREVVELKTFGGLTFREIGEVTGLPQGTVATRYRTAIGKLRGWLVRDLS
jgi:RNA polymerase sigma-70 factor (ECF subfamily)